MILQTMLGVALALLAIFLILIVLVQRGRGGGLAGALGGAGGQSAFGTKAGDTFTRVTIVTAATWIILCMVSIKFMGASENKFTTTGGGGNGPANVIAPLTPETPATETPTTETTPPAEPAE